LPEAATAKESGSNQHQQLGKHEMKIEEGQ
jgi:hypothetical protein